MVLLLLLEQIQPVDQLQLLLLVERLQAGQLAGRQMVLVRRRERLAGQLLGQQQLLLLLLVLLLVTQAGQHQGLELGLGLLLLLLLLDAVGCRCDPCRELTAAVMLLLAIHQLKWTIEAPLLLLAVAVQLGRGELPLGWAANIRLLALAQVVARAPIGLLLLAGSQLLRMDQLAQGQSLLVSLEGGQPLLVQLLVLDELLTKVCQSVALAGGALVRAVVCYC